jgi:hypothetical protein
LDCTVTFCLNHRHHSRRRLLINSLLWACLTSDYDTREALHLRHLLHPCQGAQIAPSPVRSSSQPTAMSFGPHV